MTPRRPDRSADLDALSQKELLHEIWECLYSIRNMLLLFVVVTLATVVISVLAWVTRS